MSKHRDEDTPFSVDTEDIVRLMKEGADRRRADDEDRRRLRGKYAPPTGVCRVCSGQVVADIAYHHDGRIGGPPSNGYVAGWHCEGCFIVYKQCPTDLKEAAEALGRKG